MIKKCIIILLTEYLIFCPLNTLLPHQDLSAQNVSGKYLQIHPAVGDELEKQELKQYGLFPLKKEIDEVRFTTLSDSILIMEIRSDQGGIFKTEKIRVPASLINILWEYIDNFDALSEKEKTKFFNPNEQFWLGMTKQPGRVFPGTGQTNLKRLKLIYEAEQRARELAKEDWSDERWAREMKQDEGGTYKSAGSLLGFAIGASIGMVVGYAMQKRKVERTTEYDTGGWGGTETVEHFEYENKFAPHIGTLVGGVSGSLLGYYLGKKQDKEFYLKVPGDLRTEKIRARRAPSYLLGFGVIGTGMGFASGKFLNAPSSLKSDESDFSPIFFAIGYFGGAIIGTASLNAYSDRDARERRWKESILQNPFEKPVSIQILPIGINTYSYSTPDLPAGQNFTGYKWQLLQIRF